MAALTGDIYQMLKNNESTIQAQKQTQSALSSVSSGEDNSSSNSLSEAGRVQENDAVYSQSTDNNIVGGNSVIADSSAAKNSINDANTLNQIFERTLNTQKMWLGEDYEWSLEEADTFRSMLALSDDPEDTASRYIASKGYATMFGLDTFSIYDNLDIISEYYTGGAYDSKNISLWQKIQNGFLRNDIMSLKYEYMVADIKGDTERTASLKAQIEEKEAKLGDSSNAIPKSWFDKISSSVLENLGYIVQPALEGSIPSAIITAAGLATAAAFPVAAGAIIPATTTLSTATATIFTGKQMYEWASGERYYSLMNDPEYQGVQNKGQAQLLATIEGLGTAAIETFLDGMTSRLVGKISGNQISKIGINSLVDLERRGVTNTVGQAVFEWATGALDEGFLNEAPEYMLGEVSSIIYKNSNGIVDEKTWSERYDEMKESIIDGIIVGAVYGAVAIPSSLKSQRRTALELRRTANESETMSEFESATKNMKPEGLSDEDFDTARTMIWKASQEQKQERREYLQKEFAGTVLESEEVASEELFSTIDAESGEETSVIPDGSVYRTDDNALYSEVTTDNKSNTQTVWYGNPEDHSVYGIVQIKSDGDTQTVERVRVRNGYENIRSEMVRDAISSTLSTETNVEWTPTTKGLQSVRDELINNNPNKTGLMYSSVIRGNDSDIQSLKTQIKKANPNLSDAEATLAARLTSIADVGTNTIRYETATNENTGRDVSTIRGATNTARALIYAGQNTDVSTFVHELFHAVAAIRTKEAENLSNEIRKALQNEETRSQLESFIKNNLAVWEADADINKIMSSLSEIKENSNARSWTVAQNENLAELYEAYRRSSRSIRQSLPQAIRNFLQKLTQFMNKVYGTLKDTVPLNENIAKAYDALMGFEEAAERVESKGVEAEFKAYGDAALESNRTDTKNMLYQIVNHGTSADFDKFDLDYINSGEGSQTFGRGFYFTDSEAIAESYARRGSESSRATKQSQVEYYKERLDVIEKELDKEKAQRSIDEGRQDELKAAKREKIEKTYNNWDKSVEKLVSHGKSAEEWRDSELAALEKETVYTSNNYDYLQRQYDRAKESYEEALKLPEKDAYLYKVDIPDNGYLSWNGKVSDDIVRSIAENRVLEGIVDNVDEEMQRISSFVKTGADLYAFLADAEEYEGSRRYGDEIYAIRELADAGVVGIKYPAGTLHGLPEGASSNAYNYVLFDTDNTRIVERRNLTTRENILYQDKLLDDIDSVQTIDDAEAVAREEYESELSDSDKRIAEQVFDIEESLPYDWESIFESADEDRLQREIALADALPDTELSLEDIDRLPAEPQEEGLIRGVQNLKSSYSLFVEGNAPDILYEGTDSQKDALFKSSIKDENTLRQYLAIMGEAYLYDTTTTNRIYEDHFNPQWNRWESTPATIPYIDDAYRQTLHDRLTAQLSDRGLGGAMKAALNNSAMSDSVIKKVQKELSDNARFYRNILALLMKRADMLPDSLITEVKGLDIPSREVLDIASVTEFAELAKKVNNERLRQKILNGTAKFGNDEDQKKYKELVSYTKELDKDIKEKTKEIESLEKKGEEYEKRVQNLEELNKERASILLDAEEIFSVLSDTFIPESEKREYRQQLTEEYSDLRQKYDLLSPARERDYQDAKTQEQRSKKVKDGSHYRDAKAGGHAGWRQQERGARYGTEAWVKEITETYSDIKDRIDTEYNKNKSRSYSKVAKEVIEGIRDEVKSELDSARVKLIENSARSLVLNSNKIYSTLSAMKSIADGTGVVMPKIDVEALRAAEKELTDLQKKAEKQSRQIENLKDKHEQEIYDTKTIERWKAAKDKQATIERYEKEIYDARTEERWKAAKEKQAIFEKQEEDARNQAYVVKRQIENLKDKHEQEIKDLKEEQRRKEKEKRAYQAIREEKKKIASYIMRPVSLASVDYSKAREIQAIQALIDPEFRREWVYDIKADPEQNTGYATMTVAQAKSYLNSLSDAARIDLFSYMPQDLIERLTEQRKPLNDWTIAELQTMATAVEGLKSEGKAILQAKKDVRNAQARVIKRAILSAVGGDFSKRDSSLPSSTKRMEEGTGFKARLHSIMFRTRRMQELAQLLDGGYGNKGAAYRLLVEEKRWHQDNEAKAIEKRYKTVEGFANTKNIDNMIDRVEVDLGRGVKQEFTVDQLAYAWLSQYDEENKAAVMYGSLMTEGEKGTVESKSKDINILTGESETTREWLLERSELIQDDEEFMQVARERYDALIKAAEKELTERNLWDLVNAINADFNNDDNTRRLDAASIEYFNMPLDGKENYLPIKRMAMTGENLENATADSVFNLNANKVTRDPAKGFLIERVDIAPRHQKQVDMSLLGVWQNSVKEQEHLIEFAGYIKKLRSVFESQKSSEVEREVNRKWSPALMREVKEYIELVANPDGNTKKDPTNEFFKTFRGRTGAAYLGWKTSGIVLQAITSPASAFSELKPWEVFAAYGQIGAHPIETINTINEKSQMMKNRTMNQIVDEALQRRNQWTQSKASRRLNKFEEVGQIGLTLVDRYAVAGPWLAMYERTLRESEKLGLDTATSETRAVRRADEFILRTQPVGDPTELASFFRTKSEAAKTVLQFQTSLNVVWNNLTANTIGFARQKKFASLIGNIVGYAVAGVILGLVQSGYDDDDDAKDKALKTVYWSLSQGVGSIPAAGSAIDSLSKFLITGDYDWYINKGISISPIFDKSVQALVAAGGGDGWKALSRSAEAIGIGMGLPVSGAKELWQVVSQKNPGALVGRD